MASNTDAPPSAVTAAAPPIVDSSKAYLEASLEVAKLDLKLAQEKVKLIENLMKYGIPPPETGAVASEQPVAAAKKRKRVFIDAEGNIIKRPMSGYNLYMTSQMKVLGKEGEKPNFGAVASAWKDLTEKERSDWTTKAKASVPQAVREEWIEEDDVPKKKKKREKTGYNVFVASVMKDKDNNMSMQEIAASWKNDLTEKERDEWSEKAKKGIEVDEVEKVVVVEVEEDKADDEETEEEEEEEEEEPVKKRSSSKKAPVKKSAKKPKKEGKKAAAKKAPPTPTRSTARKSKRKSKG